jgi:15-cis-phytoene synthase
MPEIDSAFASFEQKWLDAHPEQAMVAIFLAPALRVRASAFGSLIHELEDTAFNTRESQIAAAKLAWWQQELVAATNGGARHPITKRLFSDSSIQAIETKHWLTLADGALAQLDMPTPASLTEQLARLCMFYKPVALLDAALLGSVAQENDAGGHFWAISLLLRSISRIDREPSGISPIPISMIPMDMLARHDLTLSDLNQVSPKRTALIRDYLDALLGHLKSTSAELAGASLGRRVRTQLDLDLGRRAGNAMDPWAFLKANPHALRWRSLWVTWHEARAMARSA